MAERSGGAAAAGATSGLIGDLRREATHRLAERLGDERLRELRTDGEAMDTDQAVAYALALIERTNGA